MSDPETFLTEVYVLIDDYLRSLPVRLVRPGPKAALAVSEVITLAVLSQWSCFASERAFYRYAEVHLGALFPTLPHRTQFNRQVRRWQAVIAQVGVKLGRALAPAVPYEVIDSTAVPVRNVNRRGSGWLDTELDVGWSSRLRWYSGFHLLACASPEGVVTGIGVAPASVNDRHLADTFFAARAVPDPRLPAVGRSCTSIYLADKGFGGQDVEHHWRTAYGVTVLSTPQRDRKTRIWSRQLRHWLKRHRQIIETVFGRMIRCFRLDALRPHTLEGALARIATTVTLHNVTIWLNRQAGRPDLATTDVLTL